MAATTSRSLSGAVALAIFLAAFPHFARAQVLVFDAATVKPNNSGSGSSGTESTNGLLRITNQTLLRMIQYAYDVRDFQISGGPAWIRSDRYDVIAKPEGSVHDQQLRQMLQSLMAERFKLQLHRQTQEGPTYALIIGKNGPKLQSTSAGASDNSGISTNSNGVTTKMKGTQVTMVELAASLGNRVGRPVIDKTGLSGKFDFELSWVADLSTNTPDPAADNSGPSIFTALQEQLGLRLDSQKGPIETLLIDHAEKPTEN